MDPKLEKETRHVDRERMCKRGQSIEEKAAAAAAAGGGEKRELRASDNKSRLGFN